MKLPRKFIAGYGIGMLRDAASFFGIVIGQAARDVWPISFTQVTTVPR